MANVFVVLGVLIVLYKLLRSYCFIDVCVDGQWQCVSRTHKFKEPLYLTTRYPDGEIETQIPVSNDYQKKFDEALLPFHIQKLLNRLS